MTYSNEFPSIFEELADHILNGINDGVIDNENTEDWHFHLFNEDYYIIGRYEAEKWLEDHEVSVFRALGIIHEYEKNNFGETQNYADAEKTVNMLAYIFGEDILSEASADTIEELGEYLEDNYQ